MSDNELQIDLNAPAANDDLQSDDSAVLNAEIDAILAESGEVGQGEAVANAPEIETSDVLMGVIAPAFDILAPNWGVTGAEKKALCDVYGTLIDKYFPDGGFDRWGAEIAAVGVTITIFQSRIGTPRHKPIEKPKEAANDDMGAFEVAS